MRTSGIQTSEKSVIHTYAGAEESNFVVITIACIIPVQALKSSGKVTGHILSALSDGRVSMHISALDCGGSVTELMELTHFRNSFNVAGTVSGPINIYPVRPLAVWVDDGWS